MYLLRAVYKILEIRLLLLESTEFASRVVENIYLFGTSTDLTNKVTRYTCVVLNTD